MSSLPGTAGETSARHCLACLAGGLLLAVVQMIAAAQADDWPQFRGPTSNSAVSASQGPADWDLEKMVAWKIELPGRGPSSPIVVGDRVLVTASSGTNQDRLHVLCFSAADGKRLWERQFWATGRTITHPQSANAAPTPASDGQSVFAFFSSNDLAALDLEGNLLWYRGLARDYPRIGNDAGMASSPVVIGDLVIVQTESLGGALAVGIDARDGSTRWRDDRDKISSWTSPIAIRDGNAGAPAVLVQSVNRLDCFDPASGKRLWSYLEACDAISSACAAGGLIYLPSQGMTALRSTPGNREPEIVWKSNQLQPGAASPIAADGKLYVINRSGVLIVADCASGEILSRTRLTGSFWSTPILCGNHLLAFNHEDGSGQVVEFGPEAGAARVSAKIVLGERVQASPAVADKALYIRSDRHLWKLAAPAR